VARSSQRAWLENNDELFCPNPNCGFKINTKGFNVTSIVNKGIEDIEKTIRDLNKRL
jgi:hypothetical protein